MIKQAFILAAGLGTRMRELTKEIPKVMIEVSGQSMITRLIDQLLEHGVTKIVINVFYKADILMEHVKIHMRNCPASVKVIFSREAELLNSGGGIINAVHYFDDEPFFVVNSDSVFIGQLNAFSFLDKNWKDSMCALFLLMKLEKAIGYDGEGDFCLDKQGQLTLSNCNSSPYIYIGAHVVKPDIFLSYKVENIKLMDIYKKFVSVNVFKDMYGIIYPGHWLHVGTPEALKAANEFFKNHK